MHDSLLRQNENDTYLQQCAQPLTDKQNVVGVDRSVTIQIGKDIVRLRTSVTHQDHVIGGNKAVGVEISRKLFETLRKSSARTQPIACVIFQCIRSRTKQS